MQGPLLAAIGGRLGAALGRRVDLRSLQEVGGGCIHRAFRAADDGHSWFVKVNDASRADLFAAEADGLQGLAQGPLRVPQVICRGEAGGQSFLVLEWLTLAAGSARDYAKLGEQLARMHEMAGAQFGWRRDNYIGSTPQSNAADDSWPRFFGQARLAPGYSALMRRSLRSCTATCGAATPASWTRARRWSSIPRPIMATARAMWR